MAAAVAVGAALLAGSTRLSSPIWPTRAKTASSWGPSSSWVTSSVTALPPRASTTRPHWLICAISAATHAQGYLIAQPLQAEDFERLLMTTRWQDGRQARGYYASIGWQPSSQRRMTALYYDNHAELDELVRYAGRTLRADANGECRWARF